MSEIMAGFLCNNLQNSSVFAQTSASACFVKDTEQRSVHSIRQPPSTLIPETIRSKYSSLTSIKCTVICSKYNKITHCHALKPHEDFVLVINESTTIFLYDSRRSGYYSEVLLIITSFVFNGMEPQQSWGEYWLNCHFNCWGWVLVRNILFKKENCWPDRRLNPTQR